MLPRSEGSKTYTATGSLPYFDKIRSIVVLATPEGFDHGWQIIIARDPMSGRRNRYSVLRINCQFYAIRNYASEVDLQTARRTQKELVKELVECGAGSTPQLLTGWNRYEPFNYE